MSAREIIAALPKLKANDFLLVQEKVKSLASSHTTNAGGGLRAERVAGRLILAGPRVIRQAEVEAILDEFP